MSHKMITLTVGKYSKSKGRKDERQKYQYNRLHHDFRDRMWRPHAYSSGEPGVTQSLSCSLPVRWLTVVDEQVSLQGERGPEQSFALLTLERPLLRVRLQTRDTGQEHPESTRHHDDEGAWIHDVKEGRGEGRQHPVSSGDICPP